VVGPSICLDGHHLLVLAKRIYRYIRVMLKPTRKLMKIEESLLVLQGLGIQTSTSSPYYFLGATTTFIPTTKIQDIVIHEAFKGLEVRFYLAVIVEEASEVVVVFPVSEDLAGSNVC
jgi:hypothetical protein